MSSDLRSERVVLTPSQLNLRVRECLERAFPLLWLEGEITNLTLARSGHYYFSLKDEAAQVRCAMFRTRAQFLRFAPTDGARVLARVRVGLYEPRGEFQLLVEHLEPAGEGAQRRALEALKQKLAAEGLFAAERKRTLPAWPERVAVITSPTGAAIRDVLAVLARRFPLVQLDLFGSLVQGPEAAPQLCAQLRLVAQLNRHSVVLITRGGGSSEDLHAFNDESLARSIAAMPMPVIAAIGHEVDFTIAEFVADQRAATPSAAAELLVPDRQAIERRLREQRAALGFRFEQRLAFRAQRLDQLQIRLQARHPVQALAQQASRLERLRHRLLVQPRPILSRARSRLERCETVLKRWAAGESRRRLAQHLAQTQSRLSGAFARHRNDQARRLEFLRSALHTLSPLATLDRGYALVFDSARLLSSVQETTVGQKLTLRLTDGEIAATVDAIHAGLRESV